MHVQQHNILPTQYDRRLIDIFDRPGECSMFPPRRGDVGEGVPDDPGDLPPDPGDLEPSS